MASQYFGGLFTHKVSNAAITDLTPPTFAGISSLSVQTRGQIRAVWLAATDASTPIRYEVYIQASTATGLFNVANIISITSNLQYDTFTLPDGSFLQNGTTYYVGVRAIDAVSNRDSNTVSLSVISTGVTVFADSYNTEGAFAINSSNQLQGTLWCLKNSQLATSSNAVMGTASYQIYDKTGTAVVGMSQSGITADSNGQYKITAVASTLAGSLDHYMVKVTANVDGADRVDYVPLIQKVPEYEILGAFSINTSNQLNATFWATADHEAVTNVARLGTASYQVYDKTGAAVSGMSGSGITADSNGLFNITPVASTLTYDLAHYSVKVSITVDNVLRNNFLPIIGKVPTYEVSGAFSVNSSNQLQGTIWATKDELLAVSPTAVLGTASYTVYDKAGSAVAGMTESGISSDANGQFKITPVASTLDLTVNHYVIKISVTVDGVVRSDYVSLIQTAPEYEIDGVVSLNSSNQLEATFWAAANEVIKTTSLGTASYVIYDKTGALVSGMSQSGISADANGLFKITPVASTLSEDLTHYMMKVTITVDGVARSEILSINGKVPSYDVKAQFSINASNQFKVMAWLSVGTSVKKTNLSTASYTVYDEAGVAVSGLTQSGVSADSNGRFIFTATSAALLSDLTQYSVKVTIDADGKSFESYKGFTLLGT